MESCVGFYDRTSHVLQLKLMLKGHEGSLQYMLTVFMSTLRTLCTEWQGCRSLSHYLHVLLLLLLFFAIGSHFPFVLAGSSFAYWHSNNSFWPSWSLLIL